MKNLKLIMLLFCFCTLITTQTTFAQEDSRASIEKGELDSARNNENLDLSNQKEKELRELRKKYEEASTQERVAIQEEINALKESYREEVKVQDVEEVDLAEVEKKRELSDDEFISQSRKRIKSAKIRLVEDQESGTLTEEEIRQRKDKIGLAEKRLRHYEASVGDAKLEIAKRNQMILELQE